MSAPDVRPVWLTHADVSWLHTSADTPQRAEALMRLSIGFNSAPADAVAVGVEVADNTGYMSEDFVPAIARAWGMPDA